MPRAPSIEALSKELSSLLHDLGKVELARIEKGLLSKSPLVNAINLSFVKVQLNGLRLALARRGLVTESEVLQSTIDYLKEELAKKSLEVSNLSCDETDQTDATPNDDEEL